MIFILTMICNLVSFICFAKYIDALISKNNGVILNREYFSAFRDFETGRCFFSYACPFLYHFFLIICLFCVLFICEDGSSAGLRCIILTRSYSAKSISSSHQGSYYMSLWDVFLSDSGYPALKIHTALKIRLDGLKFSRTSPTLHIGTHTLSGIKLATQNIEVHIFHCMTLQNLAWRCIVIALQLLNKKVKEATKTNW